MRYNRVQKPTHTYRYLIYDKGGTAEMWGDRFLINGFCANETVTYPLPPTTP